MTLSGCSANSTVGMKREKGNKRKGVEGREEEREKENKRKGVEGGEEEREKENKRKGVEGKRRGRREMR